MSDVVRHGLIFLQLLEEDSLVETQDLFDVSEDDFLLAPEWHRDREIAATDAAPVHGLGEGLHRLEEAVDGQLHVLDVRALGLKKFGHDEPKDNNNKKEC